MLPQLARLTETTAKVCSLLSEACAGVDATPAARAAALHGNVTSSCALVDVIGDLDDPGLEALLSDAARARAEFDRVIAIGASEAAKRSRRELGHLGLAQRQGHRTAVQLIQSLTGESKGEAARQVKVGELLAEVAAVENSVRTLPNDSPAASAGTGSEPRPDDECAPGIDMEDASPIGAGAPAGAKSLLPWQHSVTNAINNGILSADAGHLILRIFESVSATCSDEARRAACVELVSLASTPRSSFGEGGTILREELLRKARQLRDAIDADGIAERFERRYEKRSLKTWHDNDGALNVHVTCDDESGVLLRQMLDMSLSPRRGGPRFATQDAWEESVRTDPRTNEQLAFDTFMALLRAGASCDDSTVFRGERPGVRVITVVGSDCADRTPHGELEGSPFALPAWLVAAAACDAGVTPVKVDCDGRVLDLGRDQRSFSPAQRVVLRLRDGGCVWPGCDRPPWQAEAHHINPWSEGGRTDVADGILLCRFHHLNLHNNHWRVRRSGTEYRLIPPASIDPEQRPIVLMSKSGEFSRILERTG